MANEGTARFGEYPVLAFRRPRNIKDDLCTARVSFPPTKSGVSGKAHGTLQEQCKRDPCELCLMVRRSPTYMSQNTGLVYQKSTATKRADCETRNLVYLVTCDVCRMQYVGETKRSFRTRIKEHKADVRHGRDTPVARHFGTPNHSHECLKAEVIEVLTADPDEGTTTVTRRKREYYWIHQLKTLYPFGMNGMG